MTDEKKMKVVVVGGGSAGWMTASYLSKMNPNLDITLIESSDIPVIGVGEATIAVLTRFIAKLGITDNDWMPYCNASYKYAIRFDNWHHIGDQYWHPFEPIPYYKSNSHVAAYWWYQQMLENNTLDRDKLYSDCFLSVDLLKENKIPRNIMSNTFADDFPIGKDYIQRVSYAYHFDAGLFGDFLKKKIAIPAGVKHIVDDVTKIHQDEKGFISKLDTKKSGSLEADLFIDCSGFRSMLLNKTLKEPFESYSDTLFCDKAIAMQIPYEDKAKELRPYTTATAMSTGWIWNTPLTSRIGTGYVYCSAFKTESEAEEEYRNYLGADRVKDLTARHIPINTGKYRRSWVKNCVAIGLSSGFVEPLESTGIHFIHAAIEKLSVGISNGSFNSADAAAFNWFMGSVMLEVKQFLGVHYGLTDREDTPFWAQVKYDTNLDIGDLPEVLSKAKFRFPNDRNGLTFQNNSWVAVLNGMNYLPLKDKSMKIPPKEIQTQLAFMKELARMKRNLLNNSKEHITVLEKMYAISK